MVSPEKLFKKWDKKTPTDASFQEVEKVAMHYLGEENVRTGKGGSHLLIIKGPITKLAAEYRDKGFSDLAWLQGDSLSISTVRGKSVKKVWVEQLIKMIRFALKYRSKEADSKREEQDEKV